MSPFDHFFFQQDEPVKGCLQFLRMHICSKDSRITEAWKYRMPFFCINHKMFCYLWMDKKNGWPYLGIVEGNKIIHPKLIQDNRARMKILLINPEQDIPLKVIDEVLRAALKLYK